jgi:hypothetical protein
MGYPPCLYNYPVFSEMRRRGEKNQAQFINAGIAELMDHGGRNLENITCLDGKECIPCDGCPVALA